ncbi:hypothetical protein ABPG75_008168 [Micractinium tetrahymenae]
MAWALGCHLRRPGSAACAAVGVAACCGGGIAGSSCSTSISSGIPAISNLLAALQHPRPDCRGSGRPYSSAAAWGGASRDGGLVPALPSGSTTGHPSMRAQLVRDFIHDSLYHPSEGYFTKHTAFGAGVVGSLQQPLDFASMDGQVEYLQAVQRVYRELQASWLTPVEILQPHYGRAIANCILQRWQEQTADALAAGDAEPPLLIYEVGGGTGTLARNMLDWLRTEHPSAYRRTRYSCIEISPVLAALQRRKLAAGGHAERFSVRQHDAADLAAWRRADEAARSSSGSGGGMGDSASSSSSSCAASSGSEGGAGEHAFIVMCEVLDNLPHDRVWRDMGSSEWQQTLVAEGDPHGDLADWAQHHRQGGGGALIELLQPASDPLIRRCLQAMHAADSSADSSSRKTGLALSAARAWRRLVGEATEEVRWLPTGCLQLLDTLRQARLSHTLIAADFDQLPEVVIAGVNAPLVASTYGGSTHDHGSYLVPRGTADIFFPTDFQLLCTLYRQAAATAAGGRPTSSSSSSSHAAALQPIASAEHMPTPDFMLRYAPDPSATRTLSGYNPLLEDYSNTAFFVGSCLWQRAAGAASSGNGGSGAAR